MGTAFHITPYSAKKSYAAVVDFCQGHVVGHRLIVTRVTTL